MGIMDSTTESPPFARPRVAAIVTEYRPLSHADVLITKLLDGYDLFWTRVEPGLQVVSLYTDQVPVNDIGRAIAAKHGVPIFPTIRDALTLGGDRLDGDGVILVGEHGDYPLNEQQQHLYPRRRFFEETVAVFRESGRVVPVFNDKHLSALWADAQWMYDTAKEMGIPFMAGSSVPIAHRSPPIQVPFGADVQEAVILGHGPLESYGYHVLEGMQCLVERRRGYETGLVAVQCLDGDAFWDAWDRVNGSAASAAPAAATGSDDSASSSGAAAARPAKRGTSAGQAADATPWLWSRDLQDAALALAPHPDEHPRAYYARRRRAAPPSGAARTSREQRPQGNGVAFLVEYADGLRATVLMLSGYVTRRAVALRLRDAPAPLATVFGEGSGPADTADTVVSGFVHFSHLAHVLERFVQRGRPVYPVERTLLTTGILDAAMTSRHQGGRRLATPHLAIRYAPPGAP
jgi:hypothetical protein